MKMLRFLKFVLIGATTSLVYFGLFALLNTIVKLDYKFALSISYVLSILFQFFSNKLFTFQAKDKTVYQFGKFILLVMLNYLLTLLIVTFFVSYEKFSPYMGIVISIGVTFITSYFFSKNWVYKSGEKNAVTA
jgi:putative flippase GtrA